MDQPQGSDPTKFSIWDAPRALLMSADEWLMAGRHLLLVIACAAALLVTLLFARTGLKWFKIAVQGQDQALVVVQTKDKVVYSCDADRIDRIVSCASVCPAFDACMTTFQSTCGASK